MVGHGVEVRKFRGVGYESTLALAVMNRRHEHGYEIVTFYRCRLACIFFSGVTCEYLMAGSKVLRNGGKQSPTYEMAGSDR